MNFNKNGGQEIFIQRFWCKRLIIITLTCPAALPPQAPDAHKSAERKKVRSLVKGFPCALIGVQFCQAFQFFEQKKWNWAYFLDFLVKTEFLRVLTEEELNLKPSRLVNSRSMFWIYMHLCSVLFSAYAFSVEKLPSDAVSS